MNNILLIIAQVIGFLVIAVDIVCMSQLTTKKVYLYNALGNALVTLQYLVLGAWTGALCSLIAVLRNIVFSRYKNNIPLYILIIYIIIVLILNIPFANSIVDMIPIINIIIYAIALWTKKIMNIKMIGLVTCIDGVIYDYNKRAYVTIFREIIDGIIAIRCIYILIKNKKTT